MNRRMKIERSHSRRDYRNIYLLSIASLAVIITLSILIVKTAVQTEAATPEQTRYYTSINIEEDDTLWDIASRYVSDTSEINNYITDIMSVNHMTDDCLYAGQHLIVYYYDSETK